MALASSTVSRVTKNRQQRRPTFASTILSVRGNGRPSNILSRSQPEGPSILDLYDQIYQQLAEPEHFWDLPIEFPEEVPDFAAARLAELLRNDVPDQTNIIFPFTDDVLPIGEEVLPDFPLGEFEEQNQNFLAYRDQEDEIVVDNLEDIDFRGLETFDVNAYLDNAVQAQASESPTTESSSISDRSPISSQSSIVPASDMDSPSSASATSSNMHAHAHIDAQPNNEVDMIARSDANNNRVDLINTSTILNTNPPSVLRRYDMGTNGNLCECCENKICLACGKPKPGSDTSSSPNRSSFSSTGPSAARTREIQQLKLHKTLSQLKLHKTLSEVDSFHVFRAKDRATEVMEMLQQMEFINHQSNLHSVVEYYASGGMIPPVGMADIYVGGARVAQIPFEQRMEYFENLRAAGHRGSAWVEVSNFGKCEGILIGYQAPKAADGESPDRASEMRKSKREPSQ